MVEVCHDELGLAIAYDRYKGLMVLFLLKLCSRINTVLAWLNRINDVVQRDCNNGYG